MITVLTSRPPFAGGNIPLLTKTFTNKGVKSYDNCKYYDVEQYEIASVYELSDLLTALEEMPRKCVIRGQLKTGVSDTHVRRLSSTARDDATFEERFQPWMLCDFDNVIAPSEDMTNQERLDYLVSTLPSYFHGATYHYRWSASAGTKGWGLLSCHLWFWLDQPWDSVTLRERIRGETWDIDDAPFEPVQVHYTAKPIFNGVADPMPTERSGLIIGDHDAVVMPPYVAPYIPPMVRNHDKLITPNEAFKARLDDIGPRFHGPIRRAIGYYCRTMKDVDRAYLKDEIKSAIHAAVYSGNKRPYLDDSYLNRLISGAINKFN